MALKEKEVQDVRKWSNEAYDKARDSVDPNHEYKRTKLLMDSLVIMQGPTYLADIEKLNANAELISLAYEKELCKLSTKQLELILQAHQEGKMRRMLRTLNAIHTELLERTLFGRIRDNEKVNGKRKTTKRSSVKAKDKAARKPRKSKRAPVKNVRNNGKRKGNRVSR